MARIDTLRNPRGQSYWMLDDEDFIFGDSYDAGIGWDTYQTQDALSLWVSGSNTLIFGTKDNLYTNNRDLGFAAQTDPTLVITSSKSWATATNEWFALQYNTAGGYGSVDVGTGHIRMQDEVVCTTHVYQGDNDCFYQGDGNDFYFYFDAMDQQFKFAGLGSADANGGGVTWTLQNGGTGGTGNHSGGSWTTICGNGAGTGLDGGATFRCLYFDVKDQAATANTFIRLDNAYTTALTASMTIGSALTAGFELATAAGGMVLDSAGTILLETTGGAVITGTLTANDAAGPAFADEAVTTTNPTLIPNKTEMDTGIGWASDTLHFVLGGASYASLSTTLLTLAGDIQLTSGGTIQTDTGAITLDSAAGIVLDMTTVSSFSWAGVAGLKFDDAAIADYKALTGVTPSSIYFQSQSALDSNLAGSSIYWTAGTAHGSGTGGSIVLEAGATTSGTAGGVRICRPGSPTTDYVNITVDASYTYIATTGGDLYLNCSTKVGTISPVGENFYSFGLNGYTWKSVLVGEDRATATACSTSGLYLGLAQETRLRWNRDATGFPAASLILGLAAVGSAAADVLAISGAAITGFTNSVADTAGNALYIATQGGGVAVTTGKAGADLNINLGAGSAAGGAGPSVGGKGGSLVVRPGRGGAGSGGGAAGARGTLEVWHGDAGANDAITIEHDSNAGRIATLSGGLYILPNSQSSYSYSIVSYAANAFDLGGVANEWRSVIIGEDASSGIYMGLDQNFRLWFDETTSDKLILDQLVTNCGIQFQRNIAEVGTSPLLSLVNDHTSNTQPTLLVQQDGAGYGISMLQAAGKAALYIDATTTAHTDTAGAIDLNFKPGATGVVAIDSNLSGGIALGGGEAVYNLNLNVDGHASDNATSALYALNIGVGATGSALRYGVFLNHATWTYGIYNMSPTYFGANVLVADEKGINTGLAASDYYTLGAVDNDTSLIVECARLVGAAQPRFYASRFQLSYDVGDYQTAVPLDNYTPPTDVWEGRVHIAYDSDGGAGRIYVYANAAWHYCTMDA